MCHKIFWFFNDSNPSGPMTKRHFRIRFWFRRDIRIFYKPHGGCASHCGVNHHRAFKFQTALRGVIIKIFVSLWLLLKNNQLNSFQGWTHLSWKQYLKWKIISGTRIFFKLRLWGFRLGPTDATHPLLTSVRCPFNLLQSFKEGTHQTKTDFIILSDRHALACLRPTET